MADDKNFDMTKVANDLNEIEEEEEVKILTREEMKQLAYDSIESLTEELRPQLRSIFDLQNQFADLKDQFVQELLQLHLKYEQLYRPLFDQRSTLITSTGNENGGVPQFWKIVLLNSELAIDMIQEKDMESFNYITNITCETWSRKDQPDNSDNQTKQSQLTEGFTISFHYAPNPYFSNAVLTKTFFYDMHDEMTVAGRSKGTPIQWISPDKNLTVEFTVKKQRHKSGGKVRLVRKSIPCDSFYNFFNEIEGDDEDEGLDDLVEADVEIGLLLKDSIIPRALDYYLGLVPVDGDLGDEDEEDEEEGEDDEEEDDQE